MQRSKDDSNTSTYPQNHTQKSTRAGAAKRSLRPGGGAAVAEPASSPVPPPDALMPAFVDPRDAVLTGTISSLKKGYGFITPRGGEGRDVFFAFQSAVRVYLHLCCVHYTW
jgi:hypothetical protein